MLLEIAYISKANAHREHSLIILLGLGLFLSAVANTVACFKRFCQIEATKKKTVLYPFDRCQIKISLEISFF